MMLGRCAALVPVNLLVAGELTVQSGRSVVFVGGRESAVCMDACVGSDRWFAV